MVRKSDHRCRARCTLRRPSCTARGRGRNVPSLQTRRPSPDVLGCDVGVHDGSCVVEAGRLRISAGSGMRRSATSRRGWPASGSPVRCAARRRRAGAADRPAQLLAGRRDLDDLGQEGHGPPEHGGGEQDAQAPVRCGYRPPAPPSTGSSDHRLVFEVLSGDPRGTGARGVVAQRPLVLRRGLGSAGGRGHPVPPIRAGARSSGRARRRSPGSASCSRCARAASRCRVRRWIGSSITCSQERFLEGDLPQRALLGRADRDVVEGAAVGRAGRGLARPPGWPRRAPRSCGGSANRRPLC